MAEAADTVPAQQQAARLVATTTTTTGSSDVSASAWLQQVLALLFPSNLAAKAALFALVLALLPLLPASGSGSGSGQQAAPRIWELPHLLLLGIIISYGVFGQKNNADAVEVGDAAKLQLGGVDDEAAVEAYVSQMMQGSPLVFKENDDDGGGATCKDDEGGVQQAWSSQYLPDDPLVVVAETSAPPGTTINSGNAVITDAGEKPLLLPVRKLKPAAAEESAPAPAAIGAGDMNMMSDGISGIDEEEEEEELLLAPKAGTGYDVVHDHAIPSPSSVLDADLTLSPSSPPLFPPPPPPPPPPFLCRRRNSSLLKAKARSFNEFGALGSNRRSPNGSLGSVSAGSKQFRSRSAVQATTRSGAFDRRYDPVVPIDDEADDDETLSLGDEMVAPSSDSSFSSDLDDETIKEENSCKDDDDDGNSCDEELFELAMRPGPEGEGETETEVEDEVDRKADEFIAKFREQIRMQRVEPARR